jgi:hypothetical protein
LSIEARLSNDGGILGRELRSGSVEGNERRHLIALDATKRVPNDVEMGLRIRIDATPRQRFVRR